MFLLWKGNFGRWNTNSINLFDSLVSNLWINREEGD